MNLSDRLKNARGSAPEQEEIDGEDALSRAGEHEPRVPDISDLYYEGEVEGKRSIFGKIADVFQKKAPAAEIPAEVAADADETQGSGAFLSEEQAEARQAAIERRAAEEAKVAAAAEAGERARLAALKQREEAEALAVNGGTESDEPTIDSVDSESASNLSGLFSSAGEIDDIDQIDETELTDGLEDGFEDEPIDDADLETTDDPFELSVDDLGSFDADTFNETDSEIDEAFDAALFGDESADEIVIEPPEAETYVVEIAAEQIVLEEVQAAPIEEDDAILALRESTEAPEADEDFWSPYAQRFADIKVTSAEAYAASDVLVREPSEDTAAWAVDDAAPESGGIVIAASPDATDGIGFGGDGSDDDHEDDNHEDTDDESPTESDDDPFASLLANDELEDVGDDAVVDVLEIDDLRPTDDDSTDDDPFAIVVLADPMADELAIPEMPETSEAEDLDLAFLADPMLADPMLDDPMPEDSADDDTDIALTDIAIPVLDDPVLLTDEEASGSIDDDPIVDDADLVEPGLEATEDSTADEFDYLLPTDTAETDPSDESIEEPIDEPIDGPLPSDRELGRVPHDEDGHVTADNPFGFADSDSDGEVDADADADSAAIPLADAIADDDDWTIEDALDTPIDVSPGLLPEPSDPLDALIPLSDIEPEIEFEIDSGLVNIDDADFAPDYAADIESELGGALVDDFDTASTLGTSFDDLPPVDIAELLSDEAPDPLAVPEPVEEPETRPEPPTALEPAADAQAEPEADIWGSDIPAPSVAESPQPELDDVELEAADPELATPVPADEVWPAAQAEEQTEDTLTGLAAINAEATLPTLDGGAGISTDDLPYIDGEVGPDYELADDGTPMRRASDFEEGSTELPQRAPGENDTFGQTMTWDLPPTELDENGPVASLPAPPMIEDMPLAPQPTDAPPKSNLGRFLRRKRGGDTLYNDAKSAHECPSCGAPARTELTDTGNQTLHMSCDECFKMWQVPLT